MTATPLPIANAYAAIANGGILRVPRVTKPILPTVQTWKLPWSSVVEEKVPEGVRVLSATEAQTLRLLLAGVIAQGGTGQSAVVPGYPVAGKTGTAQKVNPQARGYMKGVYVSSFVGMIPANDPKFVIYVAVDAPKKQYYGSQVAGPLFSRVATYAVRHEGLAPRWLKEDQALGLLPDPNLSKSKSASQLKVVTPKEALARENSSSTEFSELSKETMPNIGNLTVREVQEFLQEREINVHFHGSGRVSRFEPSEGTPLKTNDKVEVWLQQ